MRVFVWCVFMRVVSARVFLCVCIDPPRWTSSSRTLWNRSLCMFCASASRRSSGSAESDSTPFFCMPSLLHVNDPPSLWPPLPPCSDRKVLQSRSQQSFSLASSIKAAQSKLWRALSEFLNFATGIETHLDCNGLRRSAEIEGPHRGK
jgi:hypothetical protein